MKLFIGCSAQDNVENKYKEDSKKIINEILKDNEIELVFGGGGNGIMGIAYNCFKENNKKIHSHNIKKYDDSVENTIYHETTIDRCKILYEKCDMCLILPGGLGTVCEIFNFMEENRVRDERKKIVIYNKDGLYNEFIKLINKLIEEKFLTNKIEELFIIENNCLNIINIIKEEAKKYE